MVGPGQQGQYDQLAAPAAPAAEAPADTAAADSRPAAEAETETSAEQQQPTRGQYSDPVTAGGPIRGQYSDPVTAGGPIRGQDEAGSSSSSVELRRYVAEVSASAEAVDQLQRQGGLDLQVGL